MEYKYVPPVRIEIMSDTLPAGIANSYTTRTVNSFTAKLD